MPRTAIPRLRERGGEKLSGRSERGRGQRCHMRDKVQTQFAISNTLGRLRNYVRDKLSDNKDKRVIVRGYQKR